MKRRALSRNLESIVFSGHIGQRSAKMSNLLRESAQTLAVDSP